MGWKEWPGWVKGGLIGSVPLALVVLFVIYVLIDSTLLNPAAGGGFGLMAVVWIPFMLIFVLIGAALGYILERLKR